MINKAFILSAGFGTRLRPHTLDKPKPMVEVAGKSLIIRTLNHFKDVQVNDVVINTHYLAEKLHEHLSGWTEQEITFSDEQEILDTGGGILKAINHFGGEDFFVTSGDGLWDDGNIPALQRMINAWDPEKMDILILLQDIKTMRITKGSGDYNLTPDGKCVRSYDKSGAYMFTSIRINRSAIFDNIEKEKFSYLELLDKAESEGRLYGLVHDSDWHHISTPEDLKNVQEHYAGQ